MKLGQLPVRGVEGVRIGEADARHDVPVVARPAKRERSPRTDHMEASLRIQLVGEAEQVGLVAPAAVVEEKQALGVAGGEPLPILQGLGHDAERPDKRAFRTAGAGFDLATSGL